MYAYLYMYIYIYTYRFYITMQIHPDVIEIFELETACVKSGHVWTLAGHLRFLEKRDYKDVMIGNRKQSG